MKLQNSNHFGPFRVDLVNECLWRGKQAVALKPKAFAVLRYLVEHPGRLVSKDELLDAVWPDTVVSDGVLKFCMREIRAALGDDPHAPRFIETLYKRGYRFIAPATTAPPVSSFKSQAPSSKTEPALSTQPSAPTLVGRETEVAQLHRGLEKALRGERQIIFVTGEPGIGKTTLVDAFVKHLPTARELWLGHGQCIEHYGVGEAYLPILSALGQLCRAPGGQRLIEFLNQQAPTWLVQMPALLRAVELQVLQRKVAGATRERMLRELAEAVEALTAERPLVLWLEDLHWGDYSTLDLVSYLAQRREYAQLLVIGTYRPVEVLAREHPLQAVKQELPVHGQCEELRLGFLTEENIAEYLAARFRPIPSPLVREGQDGGASRQQHRRQPPYPVPLPQGEREPIAAGFLHNLARAIHQRTEGNPPFIVNVADYLVAQGAIVQR
ncbi:MAG TPA: AAA family ATPase, partial [Candidatus Binatia bacterium]|nr:AAA family ATPase [Candidatus Binatia bacterium]